MRKETLSRIFAIMDGSAKDKTRKILSILAKQKTIDKLLLKGLLRELGETELASKVDSISYVSELL